MLKREREVVGTKCSDEDTLVSAVKDVDILMADVDIEVAKRVINAAERLKAIVCARAKNILFTKPNG